MCQLSSIFQGSLRETHIKLRQWWSLMMIWVPSWCSKLPEGQADFHYHQNDLYMFMTKTKTDTHRLNSLWNPILYAQMLQLFSKLFGFLLTLKYYTIVLFLGRYVSGKKGKMSCHTCFWSLNCFKKISFFNYELPLLRYVYTKSFVFKLKGTKTLKESFWI